MKISSRKMLAAVLKVMGVAEDKLDSLYTVLDKKSKLPAETFEKMLNELLEDSKVSNEIIQFMQSEDMKQIEDEYGHLEAFSEMTKLFEYLDNMGIGDYYRFDPGIVRGLAYYTGVVYEIYDKASELRAIGGGGRFDNLLKDFGGPSIPATGFGMGDCILEILLREKGLLDKKLSSKQLDYFVVYVDKKYQSEAIQVTTQLRSKGKGTNFSYKGGNLGKQLKQASAQNAARCIIIGQEIEAGQVVVKDMATGEQREVGVEDFFKSI